MNTPATSIGFRWAGCDEGDEVEHEGTAELLDDGMIEIEFAYDNGDEPVLKANQQPASGGCGIRFATRRAQTIDTAPICGGRPRFDAMTSVQKG